MRQLYPVPANPAADVDPMDLYVGAERSTPDGRPYVAVGMIGSLDGATALGGDSGSLGGDADRTVFRAVRAMADVILVGAGTARTENYGPVTLGDAAVEARRVAGRSVEPPRVAVVSGSLDLDPGSRLFSGPPPLVFTTDGADPDRMRRLSDVAEVVTAGEGHVDPARALAELAARGAGLVVCEGGPTLIGTLVAADLVDEWCVNVAPVVAGGSSKRLVAGAPEVAHPVALASLLTGGHLLAARWIRSRDSTAGEG